MNHFVEFRTSIISQINRMVSDSPRLFTVNAKEDLWNVYLESFPPDQNKIFRERRAHDCNACKRFILNFGNVVSIKNGILESIWDINNLNPVYKNVAKKLSSYVKSKEITGVFLTDQKVIGTPCNTEVTNVGSITWYHMFCNTPDICLYKGDTINGRLSSFRDNAAVFKRSLNEITQDSLDEVLELITQGSLYRGEEFEQIIRTFYSCKREYQEKQNDRDKELYVWEKSVKIGENVSRIRNHAIGTLLVNISEGEDLDSAVRKYEAIMAPQNYKRPKAIFSKRMVEEAEKYINDEGYSESLKRRFATLDDITPNDILFSNKDASARIVKEDIFSQMKREVRPVGNKFSRVEDVDVSNFINNVLPSASELEVMVEPRHSKNLVSLIAPENRNSKSMFKWNNGFSWAYTGNIADSDIKANVKRAGGNVSGDVRFSIQWGDESGGDRNDLDAHCSTPNKEIFYADRKDNRTTGFLDVDIIHPVKGMKPVENIVFPSSGLLYPGAYKFWVDCFSNRGGKSGFSAEIEVKGTVKRFEFHNPIMQNGKYHVATLIVHQDGLLELDTSKSECVVSDGGGSCNEWGIENCRFAKVSVMCLSPNHWESGNKTGNKHYFFFLDGCKNPENPNGMYNEFLKEDLLKHKRVFEALGDKLSVEDSDDQLSGLGFSSTQRNNILVKVKGSTERVIRLKF